MANATQNPNAGLHSGHWTTTADKSGTYEFNTAGKFVDRNIDLIIPQAELGSVTGSGSATVTVGVGTKSGNNYPLTATGGTSISGTATATFSTQGFTDSATYNGTISGTANVSGSLPAIGLTASGSGEATVTTVSVGTKSGTSYPITGTATGTGSASATISSTGYGTKGVESGSGSTSVTAKLDSSIPAASASVTLTGTATKPTVAKNSATNASSGSITTSKPGSGYYVAVQGTAPATTGTLTPEIATNGYLGATSEISTSGSISSSTGDVYYVPLTGSSLGNTAKTGVTYSENTSVTIPSKGALYIEGGYIGPTMITLDQMLDGKPDTAGTAATHILDGYVAYSVDGEKLTGTMANNGALGGTIETQNGSYTIPAGFTEGGTVTASLPTMTLPTAASTTSSGTLKATVSRSTSDQYINIPTGYNDTAVNYKISKTPNAGAATTVPTAVTTEVTVGSTATSGYYTVTNTIGATSSHASAGWVGTAAETGSKSIQVGKITAGSITNNTSGGTSTGTINSGAQIKIAKGYYPSDLYYTAQSEATKSAITGTLGTSITTGYTAPTLVDTTSTGVPYVTITGNGSMTTGNIFNGTANAKTQYMEVYAGTFSVT